MCDAHRWCGMVDAGSEIMVYYPFDEKMEI